MLPISTNKVITRFAPSPTGMLHIGNARSALINWLFAKSMNGTFILRFDDTDLERSKEQYKHAIAKDLRWLGLVWDDIFYQSQRIAQYHQVIHELLEKGRLYECFETPEELELKRKMRLTQNLPPIYDRSALQLSQEKKEQYLLEGRRPHYRFLLQHEQIQWNDMIKGSIHYDGSDLSDPIVVRSDGSMTYMLCSVIDDVDYNISHIIRGEDHVTNTAMQIQMFQALNAPAPIFAHLSLVKSKEDKISKRIGGFEIESLRSTVGLEPMAINSFFALIGSSKNVKPYLNLRDLAEDFDITKFSKSSTIYSPEELERVNHKLLLSSSFADIEPRLQEEGFGFVTPAIWNVVKNNLQSLLELELWRAVLDLDVFYNNRVTNNSQEDKIFLNQAAILFSKIRQETQGIDEVWSAWIESIKEHFPDRKGPALFLPLRLALTNLATGPELKDLLRLLTPEEIVRRLNTF
ncbi:Glutamate--tRNA ligase [Rickettsiales endosymbiont of Paramecium tredecaurelia]|uniref:glutamate--tRNA ligase n=1 Tax=Candidatus Sarmatiella mevalonica TaxID=2770581 RepID=UPI001923ABC5|nr:glutamate--tRNA ligase [Candidatus Sarmatiella mevalonica]MBL3284995.1 Glutamate--tRNA ligase [Candidatus Sarmatiella mevalonica]